MSNLDIDFTRRNKKARPLTDPERERLEEFVESIHYSSRYVPRPCTAVVTRWSRNEPHRESCNTITVAESAGPAFVD